jgi:hypothetical protein
MASKAKKALTESKRQSKPETANPSGAANLAALYAAYLRWKSVRDSEPANSDRYCEAVDRMFPIETEIMEFPSTVPTSTLGDVLIMARVAWDQMNDDPEEPTPWDNFVLYLAPAILRLDAEADERAIDLWLYSLATGERKADKSGAAPAKLAAPGAVNRCACETQLTEIESLLKAAHLSASAARQANVLDESRGCAAAAEAVMAACVVEAEKLRATLYGEGA